MFFLRYVEMVYLVFYYGKKITALIFLEKNVLAPPLLASDFRCMYVPFHLSATLPLFHPRSAPGVRKTCITRFYELVTRFHDLLARYHDLKYTLHVPVE